MKSNDVFTVPECDLRSVSVQLHTHVEGLYTADANISLQKKISAAFIFRIEVDFFQTFSL